jgi:hypothetical protein
MSKDLAGFTAGIGGCGCMVVLLIIPLSILMSTVYLWVA